MRAAKKIDYAAVAALSIIAAVAIDGGRSSAAGVAGAAFALFAISSVLALWGYRKALYITFSLVVIATIAGTFYAS